jgi:hypothetical protein
MRACVGQLAQGEFGERDGLVAPALPAARGWVAAVVVAVPLGLVVRVGWSWAAPGSLAGRAESREGRPASGESALSLAVPGSQAETESREECPALYPALPDSQVAWGESQGDSIWPAW